MAMGQGRTRSVVGRMEQRAGELVGCVRSEVSVVDGAVEELTKSEAPLGCGGVEKACADALAHMS